jgi:hypothetical protein
VIDLGGLCTSFVNEKFLIHLCCGHNKQRRLRCTTILLKNFVRSIVLEGWKQSKVNNTLLELDVK